MSKQASRVKRWTNAASRAVEALEELCDLQTEYTDWKESLPENLESSAIAEKLETVCDLDLDDALSTAQEAKGIDLPLGFGRD